MNPSPLAAVALLSSTLAAAQMSDAGSPQTRGSVVQHGTCEQILFACTMGGWVYEIGNYATTPTPTFLFDLTPVNGAVYDIAYDRTTDLLYGIGTDGTWQADLQGNVTGLGVMPGWAMSSLDVSASGVIYARTAWNLVTLDLGVMQQTWIGSTGSLSAGDIAVDEVGGLLGSTVISDIDALDAFTGQGTYIGTAGIGPIAGLEIDCDGVLYGVTAGGDLYTLERGTATPTLIGSLGLAQAITGLAFFQPVDLPVGNQSCPGVVNSTGAGGLLVAYGSTVVSENGLVLNASLLPPDLFAFIVASQAQAFVANPGGSQGNLCLANPIARFAGQVGPALGGMYNLSVDLFDVPLPPTFAYVVQPGETWTFQCWYRDLNPGPTSNFTSAVEVLFR